MSGYQLPEYIVSPSDRYALAANIAAFLVANGQSIYGEWRGRMPAADQRRVFGAKIGKGLIVVNGAEERVSHRVKVCFGLDTDERVALRCRP